MLFDHCSRYLEAPHLLSLVIKEYDTVCLVGGVRATLCRWSIPRLLCLHLLHTPDLRSNPPLVLIGHPGRHLDSLLSHCNLIGCLLEVTGDANHICIGLFLLI